ncbi:hypothetical protein [Metamycoplasma hyosynoviae]|uniref:hypothetical protein n=1 Tax=Metamycoplasma hyosynoviae TaxID=29559 RepID=UPI00249A5401|nr:hypothetical protein [Metamycoplasma hyosynoviae]MDI3064016.1 hypothetical protein [Metamycoplasma hyosynoviae]
MNRRVWRALLIFLPLIFIIILFVSFIITKQKNGYRPSIYNYESYLSPKIIEKVKKQYNYKEFKEVNEFTQALYAEKAIAGVGSDFQAARLIIDNKIKKLDFTQIYGTTANIWEKRKKLYRQEIVEHFEEFDKQIYAEIKAKNTNNFKAKILSDKTYDVDGDGKEDHFYEYIIPYYSQDKGVAYNIDNSFRPNINISNLEEELQKKKYSWEEIIKILRAHNYNRFGWTNAYYDNLMIGSIYKNINPYNKFTDLNYKNAIDGFVDFVEKVGGKSIKDTEYNFFTGDGLELLNHLIEPKEKRIEAAILYNGDAIDAYYSSDNFSNAKEEQIRFVRPKINYLLTDCWIVSKSLSDKQTNNFLKILKNNIYVNLDVNQELSLKLKSLEITFLDEIKERLNKDIIVQQKEEYKYEPQKIVDIDNMVALINKQNKTMSDIQQILNYRNEGYFQDLFSETFSETKIAEVKNFDFICYTPIDELTYEFIKKWYFMNDETVLEIFQQPKKSSDYTLLTYPIINTNLRTKIASYYFEKTKS